MSATASIPNVSAVSGPTPPGAGGAGKAAQPGGFDALLNAFFGAEGAEGAVDPALAGLLQLGTPGQAVVAAEGAPVEAEGDAATPDDGGDAEAAPVDPAAALALLAALAAPTQATTPEVTTALAPTEAAPQPPVVADAATAELPTFLPAEAAQTDVAAQAAETQAKPAAAQAPAQTAAQPTALPQAAAGATSAAPPPPAPAPPPVPEAAPAQPQAIAQAAVAQAATAEVPEAAPQAPAPREKAEGKTERTEAKGSAPAARTEAFAATPATAQPRTGGALPPAGQDAGKPDTNLADAVAPDAVAHDAHAHLDPHEAAPAPAAPTSTATATPAPTHAAAVRGSPETVAAMAAQIVKKLEGRSTRFDLELHPAELGRVDVRVEINHQGKLTAAMSFDSPQAANELKARSAELQRALEQAGFDLSGGMSFDVAGDRGQGAQQQLAEQWADRDAGAGFRGRAFRAALDTAGQADSGAASALSLRRGLRSGVDVRI